MGTKLKEMRISAVSGKSKDGKSTSINVREIKNGFIIRKTVEGKDAKGEWKYEEHEWYSKDNPLEFNNGDKSLAELFS